MPTGFCTFQSEYSWPQDFQQNKLIMNILLSKLVPTTKTDNSCQDSPKSRYTGVHKQSNPARQQATSPWGL